MNTGGVSRALSTLLSELVHGAARTGAYILNQGDPGLLHSLDRLDASAASRVHGAGASIAAHVDHLRYGLSLLNRWAAGEKDPWTQADWTASWRTTSVTDSEWDRLRGSLREEARRWSDAVGTARDMEEIELNGMLASIAHLAYHLGAIRQMDRAARGPSAAEEETLERSPSG